MTEPTPEEAFALIDAYAKQHPLVGHVLKWLADKIRRPAVPFRESNIYYETVWECEPPKWGQPYRVLEEEWDEDFTERTIKRIEK